MAGGRKTPVTFGAVEVSGRLSLPEKSKNRGYYSFELLGEEVDGFDAQAYMRY
jgi:hypothetical protein